MKAKDRSNNKYGLLQAIRDECLNCDHLFGSPFASGCKAGEYVGDIDAKEWCRSYKAISAIGDKELRERKGKENEK